MEKGVRARVMSAQGEGEAALVRGTLEFCCLRMWMVRRASIQIEDRQIGCSCDRVWSRLFPWSQGDC